MLDSMRFHQAGLDTAALVKPERCASGSDTMFSAVRIFGPGAITLGWATCSPGLGLKGLGAGRWKAGQAGFRIRVWRRPPAPG